MAGRISSALFAVLRLWPLRAVVALAAPLGDHLARSFLVAKRRVLGDYGAVIPRIEWDVFHDGAPADRERLSAFLGGWYSDHPGELDALLARVLPDTSPEGRRLLYARVRESAAGLDEGAREAARAYATATAEATEALAATLVEPLVRDTTGERFAALVDRVLRGSEPRTKQAFYAWVEDRAAKDEHALVYAERVFDAIRAGVARFKGPLEGLRILELGPGHTLATGVLFYVNGARSYTGVDYFPIAGRDSSLYRRLREHVAWPVLLPVSTEAARAEALRRFDEAVRHEGAAVAFDETKVVCRSPVDAAKLPFPDASFDVVFSMASFEHFQDPVAAVRECARVTAPGGVGLHQIDLRDHRDFSRPLEFLRYADDEWRRTSADLFTYTNRFRKGDFERAFSESGLAVADVQVKIRAPVDPALRAQLHPRFRDRALEDLEALSAFFVVNRR